MQDDKDDKDRQADKDRQDELDTTDKNDKQHLKPRGEVQPDFPSLLQAIYVLVLLFLVDVLLMGLYIDTFGRFEDGDPVAASIIVIGGNTIVLTALMYMKRLSLASLFQPGDNSARAVLLVLTLPVMLVSAGMAVLIDDLLRVILLVLPMTKGQFEMFDRVMSGGMVSLLLLCVIAPFGEEMLFRGIFLRSFNRQYTPAQAIVFSSALFGVFHLNIYQATAAFAVGVIWAWIGLRSRSLWPCIVGHASYNLCCYLLGIALADSTPAAADSSVFSGAAPFILQVIAVACVWAGGLMLWKILGDVRVRPAGPAPD
ncbi:MAG: CPBP family intramembrane glutamic endopeptidase [Betaproteobacteria bacterium]